MGRRLMLRTRDQHKQISTASQGSRELLACVAQGRGSYFRLLGWPPDGTTIAGLAARRHVKPAVAWRQAGRSVGRWAVDAVRGCELPVQAVQGVDAQGGTSGHRQQWQLVAM